MLNPVSRSQAAQSSSRETFSATPLTALATAPISMNRVAIDETLPRIFRLARQSFIASRTRPLLAEIEVRRTRAMRQPCSIVTPRARLFTPQVTRPGIFRRHAALDENHHARRSRHDLLNSRHRNRIRRHCLARGAKARARKPSSPDTHASPRAPRPPRLLARYGFPHLTSIRAIAPQTPTLPVVATAN